MDSLPSCCVRLPVAHTFNGLLKHLRTVRKARAYPIIIKVILTSTEFKIEDPCDWRIIRGELQKIMSNRTFRGVVIL